MLRRIARAAVLAGALTAAPAPALAQTQPPESDSTVVITDRNMEDAVRDFVAEIGAAPDSANLARFDGTVCVGAHNITPEFAQKLIDQVSLVAVAVGLEPGEPGCKPNVLIMASTDGDALAARLVKDHFQKFRPVQTDGANLGKEALDLFQNSDAPVRWWHVTQTVLVDTGEAFERGASVRVRSSGRLESSVRQEMSHVLIILDTSRMGSVSFGSLADYVAIVSLAQLEAKADTSDFPSILNLFTNSAGDRGKRMTQWDLDYLVALYGTKGNAPNANREANRIANNMVRQQKEAQD